MDLLLSKEENTQLAREARFAGITKEMKETYSKKNRDYGNSFGKSLDEDGLLVSKIRLGDKLSRFNSLIKKEKALVEDESIKDTLLDMANYAIMTYMWIEENEIKYTKNV